MKRPSILELAGQIILVTLCVALFDDLLSALKTLPCSHPDAGHECYPWGMEAVDSLWYYRSKELYLGSALIQLICMLLAVLAPLWASSPRSGLLALIIVAGSGPLLIQAISLLY